MYTENLLEKIYETCEIENCTENIALKELGNKTKEKIQTIKKNQNLSEEEQNKEIEKIEEQTQQERDKIIEDTQPIMNHMHELENQPTEKQIIKIYENTTAVSILKYVGEGDSEYGTYFISLNGMGWDMSEHIAYAYHIIDNQVPAHLISLFKHTKPQHINIEIFDEIKEHIIQQKTVEFYEMKYRWGKGKVEKYIKEQEDIEQEKREK